MGSHIFNFRYLALGGMMGVTILTGAVLTTSNVKADDSSISTVDITVPESCTMSGSGMDSHTANVQNNTYTPNIGTTTLHAYCNDLGGFAIYAVGYTGDEIGGTNSTDLVGSPSTIGNIVTGLAESGSTSNWAMKLAIKSDTYDTTNNPVALDNSFGSYHAVPAAYTKVAHKNTITDMTASTGGVELTTTYAAFISQSQPAGTYSGKVKYTLVHPATEIPLQPQTATSGCINYFPNGGNVEGTMGCQSISSSDTGVTLLASNFSRAGYGFAGWNDRYDYSGTFYGPNEDITFTAGQYTGSNPGLALYAVWVKSAGSIQNWSGCSGLTGGAVTALTDQRDSETYAVAKLADGNCWMIENLRLESTASHNSDGTLAQGYGASTTYGNFSGLADAEPHTLGGSTTSTTANSLYYSGAQSGTASIDIGTGGNPGYRFPRYFNVNTPTSTSDRPQNPTTNNSTNSTSNAGMFSYGNYYTWHAAIADLSPNETNTQSTVGTSLCPAGWHLPTGGWGYAAESTIGVNVTGDSSTFREFYYLGYKIMDEVKTAYENAVNWGESFYTNSTTNFAGDTATKAFRKYPNNFIYSGGAPDEYGSSTGGGTVGHYWTSTAQASRDAFLLYIASDSLYPGTMAHIKYGGKAIRCLVSGL